MVTGSNPLSDAPSSLFEFAYSQIDQFCCCVSFRDVRAEPLSEAELAELIAEFGDRLVDRKSNDYRALSDGLKNSEAEEQIFARPKVMARPIIRDQDMLYLGWDEVVQQALLPS